MSEITQGIAPEMQQRIKVAIQKNKAIYLKGFFTFFLHVKDFKSSLLLKKKSFGFTLMGKDNEFLQFNCALELN